MKRLLLWAVAAVLPLMGGCNYLAFPMYVFAPPEPTKTVEPEFAGLEKKTLAVVIWADTATLLEYQSAQLEVTDAIIAEFKRRVPELNIVSPQRVIRYQDQNPSWRSMQPRLLCDQFGSDYAMVISLIEFGTRESGHVHLARGRIRAQAAMYQRERSADGTEPGPVWQNDGMLLVYPTDARVVLAGDDWQIRTAVEKLFAEELVRKFYKHEVPKEWSKYRNIRRAALSSVLAAVCLAVGGCQLPVYLTEVMFPYDKIPAKYTLPEGKKVLVFPDDLVNPVSYSPVKRALAQQMADMLKADKLVADVVPYDMLENLRVSDPDFNHKDIQTIGRKLGADLVVYVNIEQFSLKDNPVETLWRGRFKAKVKVIDVGKDVAKARLWPEESAGYPTVVFEPEVENPSEAFGTDLAKVMAGHLAQEIVSLFKDHEEDRFAPKKTQEQPDLP